MARQKYTWRVEVPLRWDVDRVHAALLEPATRMQQLNQWVETVELELFDDHIKLSLTMSGHDRWWIRRRAPALVAGIATQSRVGTNMFRHVDISTPPTLKSARFRTTDGRRAFKPEDGSEPGPQPAGGCQGCRDPGHFHWRRGWKTGSAVAWGRGR